jgi:predicted RNA-binding protein with PIN domain
MTTIVDGYNLIFGMGWQGKAQHSLALEKARERLVRELGNRIPAASRSDVTIVFDAKKTPIKATLADSQVNGFRVIFAANHDEADALIEELIAQHSAPKSLTVVSDDNRLQTAARRRKATPMACEAWLERLGSLAERQSTGANAETPKDQAIRQLEQTDWLAEFQLDEEPAEPESTTEEQPDTYNPFPPGYGDDLLD